MQNNILHNNLPDTKKPSVWFLFAGTAVKYAPEKPKGLSRIRWTGLISIKHKKEQLNS